MTSLRTLPDYSLDEEYEIYKEFIDAMTEAIKEVYLSLGLKSKSFNWDDYNKEILTQVGYFSRFIVAIDSEKIGLDGRIRYRSRLYIRSAMWYYAKLLKIDARKEGKRMARRICEHCEKDLTTDWQPIIGFSFDSGLIGSDCDCFPEFKE